MTASATPENYTTLTDVTDAPPTIAFELVADGAHRFDDGSVIERHRRCVVVRRARDPHQPASLGDGDTFGPAIADVGVPLRT